MPKTSIKRVKILPAAEDASIYAQANRLLISAKAHNHLGPDEFDHKYFKLKLARRFNRNAASKKLPTELVPCARKVFYDFRVVTRKLETPLKKEVQDAVLTIIADDVLKFFKIFKDNSAATALRTKKPELAGKAFKEFFRIEAAHSRLKIEMGNTVQNAFITLIVDDVLKEYEKVCAEKKSHKDELIARRKTERNDLKQRLKDQRKAEKQRLKDEREAARENLKQTRARLLEESRSTATEEVMRRARQQAEMIFTFVRQALVEKRVNVLGKLPQHFAEILSETYNHHADLIALRAEKSVFAHKVERKFRHIVIACARHAPPINLNEHVKSGLIDLLIQEVKNHHAATHEKRRQQARINGQSAASREAASKLMRAMRNDLGKASAHNERASKRIRQLYDDPDDKSGFRKNRERAHSRQQQDLTGHFIKTGNEEDAESEDKIIVVTDYEISAAEDPALVAE